MKIQTAILLSVVFLSLSTAAQKKGDSKIIITVKDTAGLYNKTRMAFAKADFIVKDLNNQDSVITFPRELKSMAGFAIAQASINGNLVVLNGFYTRRLISYYGVIKTIKGVNPIVYYKNGKLWPLLMKVAKEIGGEIEYSD